MYTLDNEALAVREVQKYLHIISQNDDSVPYVPLDGIYTDEMKVIISDYQSSRGLRSSGVVDKETFDLLFFESNEILNGTNAQNNSYEPEKFPLKRGDFGVDVSRLNLILSELRTHYIDIPNVVTGNFYREATENAVKYMQIILGVTDSGIVNHSLLLRLENELNERQKFLIYNRLT